MITIARNKQRHDHYTLSDLAAALGISVSLIWYHVYRAESYPKPTRVAGHRRLYYTREVYESIVASELKAEVEAAQSEVAQ